VTAFFVGDAKNGCLDRFCRTGTGALPPRSGHTEISGSFHKLTSCTFHYKVLSNMKTIRRFGLVMSFCVMISSCFAKEKVIGLRENIHHDDFEYSVQSVEKTDQIGNLHARGIFYIIGFQVENRARRVDHRWTNDIAYVVDETGTQRGNDARAQEELNRVQPFRFKNDYDTAAGGTETTLRV